MLKSILSLRNTDSLAKITPPPELPGGGYYNQDISCNFFNKKATFRIGKSPMTNTSAPPYDGISQQVQGVRQRLLNLTVPPAGLLYHCARHLSRCDLIYFSPVQAPKYRGNTRILLDLRKNIPQRQYSSQLSSASYTRPHDRRSLFYNLPYTNQNPQDT